MAAADDAISSWWVTLHAMRSPDRRGIAPRPWSLEQGDLRQLSQPQAERLLDAGERRQRPGRLFFSDTAHRPWECWHSRPWQWCGTKEPSRQLIAFEGAYHGDTFGPWPWVEASRCFSATV